MISPHIGRASDIFASADRRWYRFFEMIPGILAWITLIAVVFFSFTAPVGIAIFIIIFDVYWLVKTLYFTLHLRVAFHKTRANMQIDWLENVKAINPAEYTLRDLESWEDLYHLVILPTYKESWEVVRDSLRGLTGAHYLSKRLIVALAQEERAGKAHNAFIADQAKKQFGDGFHSIVVTEHPEGLQGELAGKGANASWAGNKAVAECIDRNKIDHERVLVSVFDVDTVVFPEYFSRLAYSFLTTHDPLHASYQPIPLFTNNIWEAPALARVVAFSSTFWQSIQQERIENLITFSSHSMPLTAVVDIGYWQKNMVNEDSRVFWQCFLKYDGHYRVIPLYYFVSMDANVATTFFKTMVNIYKQHRRWGYGVENIPYFLFGFMKNKQIPLRLKYFYTWRLLEGFWSWSTNTLIIFLLGWLPVVVGGPEFNQTILSFNLPVLTRWLMVVASVGMVTTAILSMILLPPRPPRFGRFRHLLMFLQWILLPVTLILFGALPGLEAQTRLMLGRYMGFWVTPKHRKTTQNAPPAESEPNVPEVVENAQAPDRILKDHLPPHGLA